MRRREFLVLAGATTALPVATRAQTPRPVLDKLNTEKEQILKYRFLPLPNRGLEELKDFVKSEIVRWGKVVHEAGIAASQ
jgi:tripartite-type tricarboxylate transporter receptor subunit TctC